MTEQTALLERETAGLHVALSWLPITDMVVLTARVGEEQVAVTVAHERARDAFDHPTLYLSEEQVQRLFPRRAPE